MTVSAATELSKRSGTLELDGKTSGQLVYRVLSDTTTESPAAVLGASGLPSVGDTDGIAVCLRITAAQTDEPYAWEVTAEFGPPPSGQDADPDSSDPNPLDRPRQESYGNVAIQAPLIADRDGKAFVNSAGQWFDPPVMGEIIHPTMSITQNMAAFNAGVMLTYVGFVNSDTFEGAAAGTVLCRALTGKKIWEVVSDVMTYYFEVTGEFEFAPEGWTKYVLDVGRYEWDSGASKWKPILDSSGMPVADPVMLNGSGAPLGSVDPLDAVFLEFEPYGEVAFSGMGF